MMSWGNFEHDMTTTCFWIHLDLYDSSTTYQLDMPSGGCCHTDDWNMTWSATAMRRRQYLRTPLYPLYLVQIQHITFLPTRPTLLRGHCLQSRIPLLCVQGKSLSSKLPGQYGPHQGWPRLAWACSLARTCPQECSILHLRQSPGRTPPNIDYWRRFQHLSQNLRCLTKLRRSWHIYEVFPTVSAAIFFYLPIYILLLYNTLRL